MVPHGATRLWKPSSNRLRYPPSRSIPPRASERIPSPEATSGNRFVDNVRPRTWSLSTSRPSRASDRAFNCQSRWEGRDSFARIWKATRQSNPSRDPTDVRTASESRWRTPLRVGGSSVSGETLNRRRSPSKVPMELVTPDVSIRNSTRERSGFSPSIAKARSSLGGFRNPVAPNSSRIRANGPLLTVRTGALGSRVVGRLPENKREVPCTVPMASTDRVLTCAESPTRRQVSYPWNSRSPEMRSTFNKAADPLAPPSTGSPTSPPTSPSDSTIGRSGSHRAGRLSRSWIRLKKPNWLAGRSRKWTRTSSAKSPSAHSRWIRLYSSRSPCASSWATSGSRTNSGRPI